ncbi:MAG: hypothetical protein ABEI98_00065 [Halorhabdus sp.]
MGIKEKFAAHYAAAAVLFVGMFGGDTSHVEAYRDVARAQASAGNLVGLIIGVTISAIVGIGVGVPIMNQVISDANLTGTTALIAGFIPVMLTLMVFVATAAPIMRRT